MDSQWADGSDEFVEPKTPPIPRPLNHPKFPGVDRRTWHGMNFREFIVEGSSDEWHGQGSNQTRNIWQYNRHKNICDDDENQCPLRPERNEPIDGVEIFFQCWQRFVWAVKETLWEFPAIFSSFPFEPNCSVNKVQGRVRSVEGN